MFSKFVYAHIIPYTCRVYTYFLTHIQTDHLIRDSGESVTDSTDEDRGWGGLGVYEYSKKGLPHALVHARELVETGGHHGAYCTAVAEAKHKQAIKRAAQYSKTCGSLNTTQDYMLNWVLRQEVFDSIRLLHQKTKALATAAVSSREEDDEQRRHTLLTPLHYTRDWQQLHSCDPLESSRNLSSVTWSSTFLSKDVLITREELLVLFRTKLMMDETMENLIRIAKHLYLDCFGSMTIQDSDKCRKIVGLSRASPGRRDFVHLRGIENNTVLSAQVYFCVSSVHVYVLFSTYTYCLYTCYLLRIHSYCQPCTYTYFLARIRTVCIRAIFYVYTHTNYVVLWFVFMSTFAYTRIFTRLRTLRSSCLSKSKVLQIIQMVMEFVCQDISRKRMMVTTTVSF